MEGQLTNYQCPSCAGGLEFSAETGKLECPYCGSGYEVWEVEALYSQKEQETAAVSTQWDTSALQDDWGEDTEKMTSYICPSCGAELICEDTTVATACPYCGNPTVVPGNFAGALRPEFVIPFRLTKKEAIEALKKHYKGKRFLPKTFLEENTVGKIQGVYVPFWLYDGEASGNFVYEATNIREFREGNDWEVTETSHFTVLRNGNLTFEKVPVDASKKMPDDYMDSIEPFDYSALTPFSSAYLPGFLADKYDVTVDEGNERAKQRCLNTLENLMRDSVQGYSTCVQRSGMTNMIRGAVHYALLPVWMLTVKWNGQNYLFAINGQTGRTAGVLPASKGKALAYFAKLAGILGVIGVAAMLFLLS